MKPTYQSVLTTEASTTKLPRKTALASAAATAAYIRISRSFNSSSNNSVNRPTRSQVRRQSYIHRLYTQTHGMRKRRLAKGNGEQHLRTLLYEFLAITTTATTTPVAVATTTMATTGVHLTPFSDATVSTATAAIATNATSLTAVPTTLATTLSAVFPSVTTANAFIQINSTAFSGGPPDGSANVKTALFDSDTSTDNILSISSVVGPINTTATTTVSFMDAYLLAMPWPKALGVVIFLILILVTVVGNTLVILSVLTTRRLRTVTNCFVMNLAITDWLVGTCVMPPAVILYVVGSWRYGWILCDIWISLDVLLCTSSILSLCAISLDRYLAVTQPLTYSKKRRSKRLALLMIFIVWVTALLITCPPYLGWYEKGRRQEGNVICRYNQNKGYVVFSAMGSFFIPLAVMMYVYMKIGLVLTSRRQRIARDANSERTADHDIDCDNFISESEHYQCATPKFPSFKSRWGSGHATNSNNCSVKNLCLHCGKCNKPYLSNATHRGSATINGTLGTNVVVGGLKHQASFYELVEISRLTSIIQCPAINCKYSGVCMHSNSASVPLAERRSSSLPMQTVHFVEDGTSCSDNCLAVNSIATTSLTTTTGLKFNPIIGHNQQQHSQHHHNHHHHHPHRIPMRVSTTKRDTKTAKTLTIVMGGFIACWLPFFIYYLLMPFLPPAAVFQGLMSFLTWVGWVNCAINPFIYAFYNPDFRTAFWRLTCRRICKQKPTPNHLAMFRG
ncbi:tyramine receptor 1 [Ceratitis capitata]|uniref:tyramine receptor 1 n=1 Tax=Ceratitis capitata TaxID=7213 RepID=UPI000329AECC|nr:tyramine receptor 1 [Ceratitis capitata]XP_020715348.1 tyramine receptor 1 [Ceratitis capitata]XP_020715349.1 tyramine receptor 1 [Ceratitis capitata]XP_020715350.1 tyramine receptor 1 [Ceratitis capitata]XP_020715351.1 tyramine receptor 1 [Ceratitis capitata]